MSSSHLSSVSSHLQSGSSAPDQDKFAVLPTYDQLPPFEGRPGCAWDVWGKGDQLGTVNLLTEDVIRKAAADEIRTGRSVSLNLPINFMHKPAYRRITPEVHIISKVPGRAGRDDELHFNPQSGTQWDGLRHCGVLGDINVFYQGLPEQDVTVGVMSFPDPRNVDPQQIRNGIHNWAKHGILGRGVLLDMTRYYKLKNLPPIKPCTTQVIPLRDLIDCAKLEGVEFRRGDILLIRAGFIKWYLEESSDEDRVDLSRAGTETFAGIERSEEMKAFLWNNHFAAIASDQPAVESWPPPKGEPLLHETLLGFWGCPMGEMFDLEELSKTCEELNRWSFFFTSWPLNSLGGVSSTANAGATF